MQTITSTRPAATAPSPSPALRSRFKILWPLVLILVLGFSEPLFDLVRFATDSELYSHIVLIPLISLHLGWLKRKELILNPKPNLRFAALSVLAGLILLAGYWIAAARGSTFKTADYLAITLYAFLCIFLGLLLAFVGRRALRPLAFPLGFLVFMVPFPTKVCEWIESFLQHGSAEAAYWLLKLTGMPVFRNGTEFKLPGFSMEVAPQCSGIHSSLVLFITSLIAGYLLLRSNWSRGAFAALVIPLAILRNGFRIAVLGYLCVQIDPQWIHSDLHRRGGPLFFAASLVPLFILLFVLRKLERRKSKSTSSTDY